MAPKKKTEQPEAAPADDVQMDDASTAVEPAENVPDEGNPAIIRDTDQRIRVVRALSMR
jgi:hypothetical protein